MPRVGMPVPGIDFLDEAVLLARKEQLDLAGAGVTGTVSGAKAVATIPGGGGGVTDHGALTGLADDDHTQYMKEEASGGLASEVPDHTHESAAQAGTLDHGLALTGLTDDDHTQYQKESEKSAASGYASLDASTLVPAAEMGTGSPSAAAYLRGDRAWTAFPSIPNPATTVTDETTEGIAAAVGTGALYARNDHTHGTGLWTRRLYLDMATQSHTGDTLETTLNTYTLPANTLGTTKGLRIRMAITAAGGANNRTIRLYLGATLLIQFTETSAADKIAECIVYNITATAQVLHEWVRRGASSGETDALTGTEDTTVNVVIKTTGQLANSGDTIAVVMFSVELLP